MWHVVDAPLCEGLTPKEDIVARTIVLLLDEIAALRTRVARLELQNFPSLRPQDGDFDVRFNSLYPSVRPTGDTKGDPSPETQGVGSDSGGGAG